MKNKRVKILLVRGRYFNRYEMQNYEPLVKKGFQIYGVSSLRPIHDNFKFPLIKLPSPADLPDFPYKMPILNRLCLGDAMGLVGLEKVVRAIQPDIVHGRETYFGFTYQLAKLKAKGLVKKLLVTCSETRAFNHEGIWRRRRLKSFVRSQTDMFHTLTVKAKRALIGESVSTDRIKVIRYGVDQKLFYPAKRQASKTLRLLFVGRLVKEKGVDDLIKIYTYLKKRKINFRLIVAGSGPLALKLAGAGLKADTYPYHQMPDVYRQADILISLSKTTPYWEELFGMNLVEAMSCGVVPVAYDSGAIPEVVGYRDLIFPESNWSLVADMLIKLSQNPRLLTRYKDLVYDRAVKRYNITHQSDKLVRLYLSLINQK